MRFENDDTDDLEPDEPERPEEIERRPDRGEVSSTEVKVVGLFEEGEHNYFVLLRDHRDRQLPILIGPFETQAILLGLKGLQSGERPTPRPMTHDLLKSVIEHLGARVERLTIDDLWQETYYARLSLAVGDRLVEVDTRPSDGIALALRAGAPIFVSETVWEETQRGDDNENRPPLE
ncbi:MAG: bifunctional nuclease family protein [Armatimonadota bacterium]|nr:bifunctional nuclease family protein [Armatimonadota bacterium]